MDEVKEGRQRKTLKWVIAVLVLLAIGLIVAIILTAIMGNKKPDGNDTPGDGGSTQQLSELEKLYAFYVEDVEKISIKADEILAADPTDGWSVEKLYLDQINLYISEGALDIVGEFLQTGIEQLIVRGLKKEALDFLTLTDLTPVIGIENCLVIFDAISLASELGDSENLSKYELLSANTDDGFGSACNTSEDAINLYNRILTRRESL